MSHLRLVSQHSDATGMTAKNLAIVWAPNLLRRRDEIVLSGNYSPHLKHSAVDLHDVAVQAACTECLIRFRDVLFADCVPKMELGESFELGILVGEKEKEVDIDMAIKERREQKSGNVSNYSQISILGILRISILR